MPVLFDDQVDDPIVVDVQESFIGGQVSNLRANQLDGSQASYLQNCDVSRNGRATTRRGTSLLGAGVAGAGTYCQGLFYYDSIANQYLVAASNAQLYNYTGGIWTRIAAAWTGTDTSVPYHFAQGVDVLYFSDGIGTLRAWDGSTHTDLGGATNTSPPPTIGALKYFNGRLIAAKIPTDPDGVYFSNFLPVVAANQWNRTTQQLRVGGGEGDPITGLQPWLDFNLIVFKKRSIWLVNANPAQTVDQFTIKPIHKYIGCLAPRTAAQVGSDILFLANDGVRSVSRTLATETQSEVGPNLSEPVQNIIDRINWAYVSTAVGTFKDNKYMLALPLDAATSPNYILVYSAINKSWSGLWTGLTPTAFAIYADSGVNKLAIGQNTGTVYQYLDYVQVANEVDATYQDQGVDIATIIKTKGFTLGEILSPKAGLSVETEFYGSSADVSLKYYIDDAATASAFAGPFATYAAGVTLPVTLPFVLGRTGIIRKAFGCTADRIGRFRELVWEISSTSKKMSLRDVKLTGFVDSMLLNI